MTVPRHFLSLDDCTPAELQALLARGSAFRALHAAGTVQQPLRGRTLAMVFTQNSTRTRVAFEAGMAQLGGHAIFLSPGDSQLGRGEPVEDTARVLSEMVDAITVRISDHAALERFAAAASVPVINAMTARFHPCQLLADMQTWQELRGPVAGRRAAFVGDGYNMCHSYIVAARQFGFHLSVACPAGYGPDPALLRDNAGHVTVCADVASAVRGASLVVTDVWSSMGHEAERARRRADFAGFQVTRRLLDAAAPDVLFMHCLPAHRGEEVSDDLLDDPRAAVWREAGNRLHSQKALLEFLLAPPAPAPAAGVRT
jgi:ornithine carbamoyltransferase